MTPPPPLTLLASSLPLIAHLMQPSATLTLLMTLPAAVVAVLLVTRR